MALRNSRYFPFNVNDRFPKARGARTFTSAATSIDPYRFSGVGDLYIRDMPRATRARAAKGALREKTDGETNVVSPAPDAKAVGAVKAVAAAATDAAEAVEEEWSMEREFREIDEECEFPIAIARSVLQGQHPRARGASRASTRPRKSRARTAPTATDGRFPQPLRTPYALCSGQAMRGDHEERRGLRGDDPQATQEGDRQDSQEGAPPTPKPRDDRFHRTLQLRHPETDIGPPLARDSRAPLPTPSLANRSEACP